MRGLKLTAAILTIISGAASLYVGLAVGLSGLWLGSLVGSYAMPLMLVGIVEAILGIAFIIMGSMFCKRKDQKGLAITIAVLNIISLVAGILMPLFHGAGTISIGAMDVVGWIIPVFVIVVCFIYAAKVGKDSPQAPLPQQPPQQQPPQQPPQTPQQ